MSNLLGVINNHRSIRSYSNKQVDQEDLVEIIKAGQMASTSSFIQAYSVIQVNDKEKRKLLAEYSGGQSYVADAPVFLVFLADLYRLKESILETGNEPIFSTMESFLLASIDASLFAQNVMVAAESKGLGGVYIGGIRNQLEKVGDVLELPDLVLPLFGMCLGYPDANIPEKKKRLPLDVVLHQDTYNTDFKNSIQLYDKAIEEYYIMRTDGQVKDTWSKKMARNFSKPLRPNLKSYIEKEGFKLE